MLYVIVCCFLYVFCFCFFFSFLCFFALFFVYLGTIYIINKYIPIITYAKILIIHLLFTTIICTLSFDICHLFNCFGC